MKNSKIKNTEIFTGATFTDEEGDHMVLEMRGRKVYGAGNSFDFEAKNKTEAKAKLTDWGYRYIGC